MLINALGVKVENVTLANVFMMPTAKMLELFYTKPPTTVSTDVLRDREALSRYAWKRLYDPKLRERLRRINVPTLVLSGKDDELLPQEYGRALAASIPNAQFLSFPALRHALPSEQNGRLVDTVTTFLKEKARG